MIYHYIKGTPTSVHMRKHIIIYECELSRTCQLVIMCHVVSYPVWSANEVLIYAINYNPKGVHQHLMLMLR